MFLVKLILFVFTNPIILVKCRVVSVVVLGSALPVRLLIYLRWACVPVVLRSTVLNIAVIGRIIIILIRIVWNALRRLRGVCVIAVIIIAVHNYSFHLCRCYL